MRGRPIRELSKHLFVLGLLFFAFVPIYFMLEISLKDNKQFAVNPWLPTMPFHWENYALAWQQIGGTIFNTAFIAIVTTALTLVLATLGAFFFARYRVPGARWLFWLFMALMMYPPVANMVPMFKLITSLGLYNTHFALILPATAAAQAFNIYVLRNFIEDIPQDLFDAVEIDGGGALSEIRHVVVPLSLPILGTLGIISIIAQWNNFVAPLLYLRDSNLQTVSVALMNLEGEYTRDWGQLMAGYMLASLPLIALFCFCMNLFVKGLSAGAVKGE
ncbi:MAG: carbohydrate ABC transporter permease [Victivallaceae bacterium]|nr:carbohydrate ABC transporter permease [Victivallaceae bacterium]